MKYLGLCFVIGGLCWSFGQLKKNMIHLEGKEIMKKEKEKTVEVNKNIITFRKSSSSSKELKEIENDLKNLNTTELNQEIAKLEARVKDLNLIELANKNALNQEGNDELINYFRKKTVLTMLLLEDSLEKANL